MKKVVLLLTLLTGWVNSYSQILAGHELWAYTDIIPDTLIDYVGCTTNTVIENYYIDINEDSQNDFRINASCSGGLGGQSRSITITPLNPDMFIRLGRIDSVYNNYQSYWQVAKVAMPLYYGDTINPDDAEWNSLPMFLTLSSNSAGTFQFVNDWVDTIDEYIGIKYQTISDTTYGWIRVYCPNAGRCYVKDYSFGTPTPGCADTTYNPIITASGPLTVCYGDTIILNAENGYDAYLWSTGDTTQSISVSDSGDYFVSVLVDTCWFGSDTIEIGISNPNPIIYESGDTLFCIPSFASYQWYLNGQPIAGAINQFHCWEVSGNYEVFVIDSFGCTAMSPIVEMAPAKTNTTCGNTPGSIIDNNKAIFKIYPNPATAQITIEFPATANYKNAELSIQTITGQVVNQLIIDNEKLTIDVSRFSKGLYLFKVRAGDEVVVRKVVVE